MRNKLAVAMIMGTIMITCACSKSGENTDNGLESVPVLQDVDYEKFLAQYENHEEEICSTAMNLDSEGKFSYYYTDGCIYEDFDLFEKYTYDEEKNIVTLMVH